jgi:hypothetical protein
MYFIFYLPDSVLLPCGGADEVLLFSVFFAPMLLARAVEVRLV